MQQQQKTPTEKKNDEFIAYKRISAIKLSSHEYEL